MNKEIHKSEESIKTYESNNNGGDVLNWLGLGFQDILLMRMGFLNKLRGEMGSWLSLHEPLMILLHLNVHVYRQYWRLKPF